MTRLWAFIRCGARGARRRFRGGFRARPELFETLTCVQCHSVNGTVANIAPDLGRMLDRSFTPATLAATMWNHAPAMWSAMRERQIVAGELDQQAAQDLMAFFYAARFFEKPGDAGRGKRVFERDGCAGCHTLPVSQMARPHRSHRAGRSHVESPHRDAGCNRSQRPRLPQLSAQELTDILVYLRNHPSRAIDPAYSALEPKAAARACFNRPAAPSCHQTVDALAARVQGQTLTEIAAEMWNHAPRWLRQERPTWRLLPGKCVN